MAADQIAVSGKAHYTGIPAATVTWGTPGNQTIASATTYTATIFTKFDKSPDAQISEQRDNDNEVIGINRSDKRMKYSFSAKVTGATRAACLLAAENLPLKMDVVKVVRDDAGDSSGTDTLTLWCESAQLSYTPDNAAVIDFVLMKLPQDLVPAT